MENASKALIIAGSILIAIMIISLGILVFSNMGDSAKEAANMDEQEIANFNAKIRPYLGESVPGSKVNALLQYCQSSNLLSTKNGDSTRIIDATINGASAFGSAYETYTRVDTKNKFYNVQGTVDSNGLITTIQITG